MSTFDPKSFGRKLRAAREALELTQQELAARSASLGDPDGTTISTPYISALERFERTTRPSDPMLDAMARGLGHQDSYEVREWAGMARASDWTPLLRAINTDKSLHAKDKKLLTEIVYRLVGQA